MSTLVLLHGFTGSPASFVPVAPRGARIVCPFLGGHGPDPALPRTWDEEIERLARIVADAAVGPAHLVGYSLGGRLAWSLLERAPRLFASATIIGGHPGLRSEAARQARAEADARWIALLERGLASFLEAWELSPVFATQTPAQVRAQRAIRRGHRAEGLAHSLRVLGLASMPPVDPARIEVPVEVLVGALDRSSAAQALPDARRVPDAGHNLLIERPDVIRALLARRAGRAA